MKKLLTLFALALAGCSGNPGPRPPAPPVATPTPAVSASPSPGTPATPRPPRPDQPDPPSPSPKPSPSSKPTPRPDPRVTLCHHFDRENEQGGKDRGRETITVSQGTADWHLCGHKPCGDRQGPDYQGQCKERER